MADDSKSLTSRKGEVLAKNSAENMRQRRVVAPHADILETSDEFLLVADLPGVDDQSVEINLERNVLTINAYPQVERLEGYTLNFAEYAGGDFQRKFVLSDLIDRERISARMKNGVLHLHLPKAGPARPQKISIQSE